MDVMRMQNRAMPITIAFYVTFTLWFTAISYSTPSFYSVLVSPVIGKMLVVGNLALFCTVVLLAAWRGFKTSTFPSLDITVVGCTILGFDLVWRFYLSQSAWDAFKLISIALDLATPAIAMLGIFVVSNELKRSGHVKTGDELFNG